MSLIRLLILIGHLYLSSVWFGVALRTDATKTCFQKMLDYMLKI